MSALAIDAGTTGVTALVVTEAGLSLNDTLTVEQEDVDATTGSSSRLKVGTRLTRGEMLHLALMSSENRAAHALGRTFPGGLQVVSGELKLEGKDASVTVPAGKCLVGKELAAEGSHPLLGHFETRDCQ